MILILLSIGGYGLYKIIQKKRAIDITKKGQTGQAGSGIANEKIQVTQEAIRSSLDPNMPSDLYFVPDAKVLSSMSDKEKKIFMVSYTTGTTMDDVQKKYAEELVRLGWQADMSNRVMMDQTKTMQYKKGTQRLTLVIRPTKDNEEKGKTYVQLVGAEDKTVNKVPATTTNPAGQAAPQPEKK